jgi:hypothetical protein
MADFADSRLQVLREINDTTKTVRAGYKAKHYVQCSNALMKGIDLMTDLLHHAELYPDDIDQMKKLAHGFKKLEFPTMSGDYIISSSQYISYPNTENFASLCFYMYQSGSLYKEYAHQLLRIVGKKAAEHPYVRKK